jgi:isocitrate dehydrogenase
MSNGAQLSTKTPITVAYGDGIGPEIMRAVLRILEAAGAHLEIETIEVGEKLYLKGNSSGIEDKSWDSLMRTRVFLKAPITTPQGGGMKSMNVTIRKALGLYANVRPCQSFHPYVATKHPKMDLVIVRENEEDLYAGIEHRQSNDVYQCLKLVSRQGCEKIIRYAFEYAVKNARKRVSCFTKDNIMKITDGLFHKIFNAVAKEYPQIETDHYILDIGAARLADTPEIFDVIVTLNLYGDVISDIAAEIAGSVGLAGSANIGDDFAMFEAIHGSAPMIAGQGIANPSGLLLGAVMMLVHIKQPEVATRVHNAFLRTLEDGVHTGEIYDAAVSTAKVGTEGFADAVISRLGQDPVKFKKAFYGAHEDHTPEVELSKQRAQKKEMVGIDVFIEDSKSSANELGEKICALQGEAMKLTMISNRGTKVWPKGFASTKCVDHWRCRFLAQGEHHNVSHQEVMQLMQRMIDAGYDIIKTESLCYFDGEPGFSLG